MLGISMARTRVRRNQVVAITTLLTLSFPTLSSFTTRSRNKESRPSLVVVRLLVVVIIVVIMVMVVVIVVVMVVVMVVVVEMVVITTGCDCDEVCGGCGELCHLPQKSRMG